MTWFKWTIFIILKSLIELPFIIGGPVMLIITYLFHDPFNYLNQEISMTGMWLCTILFSHVAIIDYIISLTFPFFNYEFSSFPVWWEEGNKEDFKIKNYGVSNDN